MAAIDILRDFVPATVAESDAVCLRYLGYAGARLNGASTEWGALYDQAVALYAGHLYLRGKQAGAGGLAAGGVVSESAGGMSRGYGGVGGVLSPFAELQTTAPGAEFVALLKSMGPAAYPIALDSSGAV